jgi:hypothetical protein
VLDLVPTCFESANGGEHRDEFFDGADAGQPTGGVRGESGYRHTKGKCAAVAWRDVERGRLGDDTGVGIPAAFQQRIGA